MRKIKMEKEQKDCVLRERCSYVYMDEKRQWKSCGLSINGLCDSAEEHNRTIVGCEDFERKRVSYVRPLPCGGKVEGAYEVGED